jgi:Ca2+-binding RTX toxin-like protein
MAIVNVQWDFDVLGATTNTPTTYTIPNFDGLTSLVFTGTGFTYDGDGIPTAGAISSVALQVNGSGANLVTIQNLHISLSNYGSLITEILAWRDGIAWQPFITDGTATIFTPTLVRIANGDGTFTDLIGSGITENADSGLAGGIVTAFNHVASDGVTIIDGQGNLSVSFQTIVSALFDDLANAQLMALINTGDNTVTGAGSPVLDGGNTYIAHFTESQGNDAIAGSPTGVSFIEFGEFQNQSVIVDLGAGTASAGGEANTFSGILGAGGTIYDDQITGSASDNKLEGNEGNDALTPGDGVDSVFGGDGNDVIVVGAVSPGETFDGGDGFDTLVLTNTNVVGGGITTVFATSFVGSIERIEFAGPVAAPSSAVFLLAQIVGAGISNTAEFYGDANPNTVSFVASAPGTHTLAGTSFQLTNWTAGQDFVGLFANTNAPGVYNLTGSGHADAIVGGASGDTLNGANGDDVLRGNGGADALNGDAGIDTIVYSNSASRVRVNLGTGVGLDADAQGDTYTSIENAVGSAFNDVLLGNTGDNRLIGGLGNDQLTGANGNDTLIGGGGLDALNGGNGVDTADYSASAARVRVNLTAGTGLDADAQGDTLTLVENLIGSAFNDILTGDGAANTFVGGLGADTFDGAGGIDTADYSGSSESVHLDLDSGGVGGTAAGDTYANMENVIGSALSDTLSGNSSANALTGGEGDDYFFSDLGADALNGGNGYDIVDYQASASRVRVNLTTGGVDADAQGDTYVSIEMVGGTNFNDILTGDAFGNTLIGQGGNDRLTGLGGNDALSGGLGIDILEGGDGDDTLTGGAGADQFNGGANIDTADYSASAARVRVNLTTGTGLDADAQGDTLTLVENLIGTAFNDILTGDGAANSFVGGLGADAFDGAGGVDTANYAGSSEGIEVDLDGTGAGGAAAGDTYANMENIIGSAFADTLAGNSSANVLTGGEGDDYFFSDLGADALNGGNGYDIVDYQASASRVRVNLTTGGVDADAQGDTYVSIEMVGGTNFNDILTGDDLVNALIGQGGNDRLTGLGGNDTLSGGAGADILEGGDGDDQLQSGAGADTLNGGSGLDTAWYENSASRVRVNLATGTGLDADAQGDTYTLIENVTGSAFNDILTGNASANVLYGGDGLDTVDAGAGIDTIVVNDVVAGEYLNGGTGGADTLKIVSKPSDVPGDGRFVRFDLTTVLDIERLEFNANTDIIALFLTTQLGGAGLYQSATIVGSANADYLVFRMASAGSFDLGVASDFTFENWTTSQNFGDGGDLVAVFGSDGSDTINGSENADYLNGEWDGSLAFGNDVINGLGGNDVLEGWGGVDQLHGGEGDDRLTGWRQEWTSGEIIDGGDGHDTLGVGTGGTIDFRNSTITSIEALDLAADEDATGDNIVVFSAAQVGAGFAANLAVNGLAGVGDLIHITTTGGAPVDLSGWTFTHWNSVTNWSATEFPVTNGFDAIAIQGDDSADTITGSSEADSINGDGGGVHVDGAGGADTIHGGDGGDILDGWDGADQVYGDEGDDVIQVYSDEFVAGELADGGIGTDTLEVHGTTNLALGALADFERLHLVTDGVSTATFSAAQIGAGALSSTATVTFDHTESVAAQSVVINMTASGALNLSGWTISGALATDFIALNGTGGVDTITGTSINDRLVGQGGADILNGGGGFDILVGGAGADVLNGGDGIDAANYSASASRVRVNLTTGAGLDADAQGDTLSNIENLAGSAFNDILTGSAVANALIGNAGNDQLNGLGGGDTLTGGAGGDAFIFTTALGAGNIDTITDFVVVDDTIWIDDAIFTGLALGTLAAGAFQTGAAATQADDRIIYNAATGALSFDADGSGAGAAVQFASLTTGLVLTNADFLVI